MRGRDVAGRRAIVTGAASGIGAAAVARLIADGVSVLAVDVVADGLAGTHNLVADLGEDHAFARIANEAAHSDAAKSSAKSTKRTGGAL